MKKIFIITINYNSEEETHTCLASLKKVALPKDTELSIIVVDNASEKALVLSDQEKKDGIILLRSEKNLGFSGGNNLGIHYALSQGADYLMMLNNDTYVDKNIVKEFLTIMDNDSSVGLCGAKIYFAKGHEYHKNRYKKEDLGQILWYAGGYIDWKNVRGVHKGLDEVDSGQYNKVEKAEFVTGCCMFFKRDVLEKVGLFNDDYFLYYEDADLCQRTLRADYKVLYVPTAVLWHVNAASSGGSGSKLHDYFLTRNRMLLGMSYAPLRTKFALFRESIRILFSGRPWQRVAILDYYFHKLGKGNFA